MQSLQISAGSIGSGQHDHHMTDLRHVVLEERHIDAQGDHWDAILRWSGNYLIYNLLYPEAIFARISSRTHVHHHLLEHIFLFKASLHV